MSNYSIYKLCCDDCDEVYVGSTKAFRERKRCHKSRATNEAGKHYNYKIYRKIREYGGWDNWRMICIEECDETIKTKKLATTKEEEWRLKLNSKLNSNRAFKTKKDKSDDDKNYYQKNKEDIKEKRNKKYWEDPQKDHDRCKKYREDNPDKVAAANKKKNEKWHQEKDKINAERRKLVECGCGATHTKGVTARHLKTKKHIAWQNSQSICD